MTIGDWLLVAIGIAIVIDAVSSLVARFDRRPKCFLCGKKPAQFTGHIRRAVGGMDHFEYGAQWSVCSKHANRASDIVVKLADIADRIEIDQAKHHG